MAIDDLGLYARHDGLGISQDQHVAVIGCGGIGSWVALYLALAGVKAIDIYDADTLSEHNLNRFPLGPKYIGMNKSEAMAQHIAELRPDCQVTPRLNFDPDIHEDKLQDYNWVVVTTDSLKSRRMVYKAIQEYKQSAHKRTFAENPDSLQYYNPGYIECGADGHHASVTFSPAEFSTPDEENPGYQSVPVHVGPCVIAAAQACYYVLMGNVQDYQRTYRVDWVSGRLVTTEIDESGSQSEEDAADLDRIIEEANNG